MSGFTVAVLCGSRDGANGAYVDAAARLGDLIGRHRFRLVYGGGATGLMRVVADAALSHGATVIGVITDDLRRRAGIHERLGALHVVPDLGARKAQICALADAIVVLPGGYGTLDEFFDFLARVQLTEIRKALYLCDVNGYYERLVHFIQHMHNESFLGAGHHELVRVADSPETVIEWIAHSATCRPHET